MAEQNYSQKGYSYSEMSNKVVQQGRSNRSNEPTGEVESLRGRSGIGRMGDRVAGGDGSGSAKHPRPSELLNEKKKSKKQRQDPLGDAGAVARKRTENAVAASGGQTILDLGNLTGYQPTTQMARAAYETILVSIIAGSKSSTHCSVSHSVMNRLSHLLVPHLLVYPFYRPRLDPNHFWVVKPRLF